MDENGVINPVVKALKKSLDEMQKIRNGELEAKSWEDFSKEVENSMYTVNGEGSVNERTDTIENR